MFARAPFTASWSLWFRLVRPSKTISIRNLSSSINSTSASIFEPLPREELVTKFKSRLRGRQFLPGSSGSDFPEFLAEPRDSFPLSVRVKTPNHYSLAELTVKCMEFVEENFSHSPAILFRGLPAKTAGDFAIIAKAVPDKAITYEGGNGNRVELDKDVGTYTASDDPMEYTIEMHNELVYSDVFPSKVFFFCAKEPADGCGGETPLLKNSELIFRLDPDVVRKLEEKYIRYERYMPDKSHAKYMTWQHIFITENRKDVEEFAKQQGNNIRWGPNGDLYLWQIRPAFITHPVSGEKIWFNQVTAHNNSYFKAMPTFIGADIPDEKFPNHTYYGDGSEIEKEVLQHIRATSWACAVGFQWRCGDLLVMDNLAVQHGRIGFTGDRQVLAYLTA